VVKFCSSVADVVYVFCLFSIMKESDHGVDLAVNGRIILKWESVDWNHLALDVDKLRAIVNIWAHKVWGIS